jgi:hypothetical protein
MHPGSVRSEIAREAPKMLQPVLGLAYKLFFLSPEDGTLNMKYYLIRRC